jgi:hypothetical protein
MEQRAEAGDFHFAVGTRGYVRGLHANAEAFIGEKWTTRLSVQGIEPDRPTSVMPHGKNVIVSVKERVYCADLQTGEEQWSIDRPPELHAALNQGSDLVQLARIENDSAKFLVVGNSSVLEVDYASGEYTSVIHYQKPLLKRLNRLESCAAAGRREGADLVTLVGAKGTVGLLRNQEIVWTNALKGQKFGEMTVVLGKTVVLR